MAIEMAIPSDKWERFREMVSSFYFDGSPTLTRHRVDGVYGYEAATFESDQQSDIETVMEMMPEGSYIVWSVLV